MNALDPAAIMASHQPGEFNGMCRVYSHDVWPCLPYRLAEQVARLTADLAAEQAKVRKLSALSLAEIGRLHEEIDRGKR